MPRLYHFPLSPFCRKVRLVMAEKRIECELAEERYWEREPEFLKRNPAGKVPVLSIDGMNLSESAAICEYLEETRPDPPLLPDGPAERHEARRLADWFDGKFHEEASSRLLRERATKKLMKRGGPDSSDVREGLRAVGVHIDYMDGLLERRRWLAGSFLSLADFAAAAHFSALDYLDVVDWDRSESVKLWYARIKSRRAFRSVLADSVPGLSPSEQYAELDF